MNEQIQTLLVGGVVLAIFNLVIFYLIVRTAVSNGAETAKRLKHAWAQTELLVAIARQQGVEAETLSSITKQLR